MRYNATSGQERFRYYRSSTYTYQKVVALYKKVDGDVIPAPTVEVSATEALSGSSVSVSISVPSGVASVCYTLDGSDPEVSGTTITSDVSFNVTSNTTIKAVSVDSDGNYSAVVEKSVTFLPILEGLSDLKDAGKGTYFVELENAIVTYVNGSNAFIEDAEVGALVYQYGHGFTAGDCLNGVYKAVTTSYNGAFEITTLDSYSGDVTSGVKIPCTTLTLAELSQNFAAYESMRVKIEDVTVTDAIATGDRNGSISDGTNTMVLRAGVDGVAATVNATITAIGYPTIFNTTNQFAVWEQDCISETLTVSVTSIAVSDYTSNYTVNETFTFDGVVTATFSNGTTDTVTPTSVSTPDMTTAGTKTITVSYTYNGETVTTTFEINVTQAEEKTYVLYTGNLTEGDYIIYYGGKAMNSTIASNRLQYAEVEVVSDVITTSNEAVVWHIAPNGDYWTIYNAKAEKYAAGTGTRNQAALVEEITDYALWTATKTDGEFEFVNKGNAAAEVNANLQNNGTYGFACYATGTGGALSLYKQGEAPDLTGIAISDYTTEYYVGQTFSFDGVCTATFSDGSTAEVTPTSISEPDMEQAGEQTVTISYEYRGVTKTAEYTITLIVFAYEGDGTEENPYTVSDIQLGNPSGSAWVKGVILGYVTSGTKYITEGNLNDTNIALGDENGNFIPAQLSGDFQTALGVKSNPSWIGCEVAVYGSLETYFSVPGVRSVSDFNITLPNVISAAEWATVCLPFNASIATEGVTAYYVSVEDKAVTKTAVEGAVPSGTGVLLNGAAGAVTFAYEAEATAAEGNQLIGSLTDKTFSEAGTTYYILANGNDGNGGGNGIGFYWQSGTGGTSVTCAQYKAVLAVTSSTASSTGYRLDGTTMVEQLLNGSTEAVIYDITGRQLQSITGRGIYIVNGKKVIVK